MTPVLSISLSGTTVTATITATAGITVKLYQKATTDPTWVLAGTRTGSGTITIAGLVEGTQYIFCAIEDNAGVLSFPSNPVIVSTAIGFVGDSQGFDDGLIFLLQAKGEEVDFYPTGVGGGSRSILALVDRLGAQALPGVPEGSTEAFRLVVLNDDTNGISSTEINCGKSVIAIPRRWGLTKQNRMICSIENQNEVGLQILAA